MTWLRKSTDTSAAAIPLALLFSYSETYFYSFAYQNSKVMLGKINSSSGTLVKKYEFSLNPATYAAAKLSDSA